MSLNAYYPNGVKKQFHVSLFQSVVLLLFNSQDSLSFEEISAKSGLDRDELIRTLKSLSMGKVRVISRKSILQNDSKLISEGDEFRWRADFKHKMMRIKINTIQIQETVEENDQVHQSVHRDRQYQIDAAIVRVMKMRRLLAHSLLVSELYTQLKFPVKPADIKKRVESLIERDYLEREPDNPSMYRYLA